MTELKVGQEVELEYGGKAKVLKVIGSGGQGVVYLVEFNGMQWALKWYDVNKIKRPKEFRENIQNNINDGAPSNKFLWPKYLTKVTEDGTFGYLMELKPASFDSFVDILNTYKLVVDPLSGRAVKKNVRFTSLYAMVTAVINIANAFRQLHRAGKSYQDLNDGGFFINVDTGAVLVCDCDNIAPDGSNFGIGGKPGYMAPEVVRGTTKPNVQTDKYSLAVVLFKLLFRGDPMEGEKVIKDICLTESSELKHYGQNAVFVYDPNDASNRPVRGIHDNVIKFWRLYPEYIREAFTESFTTGIKEPNKRIIENEWQKLFIRLRAEILACICGAETFCLNDLTPAGTCRCPACGREYAVLEYNSNSIKAPIYCGYKMRVCELDPHFSNTEMVVGEVVENRRDRGNPGIKNCSPLVWRARLPDGKVYDVVRGKGMPVWGGLHIEIGNTHARVMQPSARRIK